MNITSEHLTGWGRMPRQTCRVWSPTSGQEIQAFLRKHDGETTIGRGLGRAYGDSSLNDAGSVTRCTRLDRFLAFDPETGVLHAEAGVSFAEIIDVFLPRGWFLPTTPGTKFVTVGGAIAADVHGKNHHRVGSFGTFVEGVEIIVGDGSTVSCSRHERSDLFYATLGGMGLTGVIVSARFRLVRVESAWITVRETRTRDVDHTLEVFARNDDSFEHSVAWIDCMARDKKLGRSVVMQGNHARQTDLSGNLAVAPLHRSERRVKAVPFTPPVSVLSPSSVRAFNGLFYATHADRSKLVDIDSFFYPLDAISGWNRLYGPRGFVQYQAFFPVDDSFAGLKSMLSVVSAAGAASFLAVLKTCGRASGGMLSYLSPGHTLALDIPYQPGETEKLAATLDRILLDHGGRIYLAKDALTDAATFRAMYPRLQKFLDVKRAYDPQGRFSSSQAVRLGLCEGSAAGNT